MNKRMPRYQMLDGWRGISILCVLATHMLPLGPKAWELNATFGPIGMCIFFMLSGFLITTTLIYRPSVKDFLIRRFFRILPLALLFIAIVFPLMDAPRDAYLPNVLFFANWPPYWLKWGNGHFWSLDVEMQFYLGIASIFLLFRQRGLYLLPIFCLLITANHFRHGDPLPLINTYYRLDEILAGSSLALARENKLGSLLPWVLNRLSPYVMIPLVVASAHPATGDLNYCRPYFSALLVGATLYQNSSGLSPILTSRKLGYIAEISYALYVIHPLTLHGWLGQGDAVTRYLKRPLSFLLAFGLAHLSTFYYEKRWINMGKRFTNHVSSGNMTPGQNASYFRQLFRFCTMRKASLWMSLLLMLLAYLFGAYSHLKNLSPIKEILQVSDTFRERPVSMVVRDDLGRLVRYPGKSEIPCPSQDSRTMVLLVFGQSNAANYGGQRYMSEYGDKIINYWDDKCYIAASPLLGATGVGGESWTLLANRLIAQNQADRVILIPAGIGGTPIKSWQSGAILNDMLLQVLKTSSARFTVTHALWHQGETDFTNGTDASLYHDMFLSLVSSLREHGMHAPFFVSVATKCGVLDTWKEDNAIAAAQRQFPDKLSGLFPGVDTDTLLGPLDRADDCHFSASGQTKFANAWLDILRDFSANPH